MKAALYTENVLHKCGHAQERRYYCYENMLQEAIENDKEKGCDNCRELKKGATNDSKF